MSGRWNLYWYEASAVIGCGEAYLPLEDLETALRALRWQDTRSLHVSAANSREARVVIVARTRHAGEAAERLVSGLAAAAPRGWNWATATVEARHVKEGIVRWPRLAVNPAQGEQVCASAAKWLAGWAATTESPAAETLELLRMCGLTRQRGEGAVMTREGLVSACCGAPVIVKGRTTQWHACTGCSRPCDVKTASI
jgi:hypothetical protein